MKLIPASRAACTMRTQSSWSGFPHAPNIIAPRHSGDTRMPVGPRVRRSIEVPSGRGRNEDGAAVVGQLGHRLEHVAEGAVRGLLLRGAGQDPGIPATAQLLDGGDVDR